MTLEARRAGAITLLIIDDEERLMRSLATSLATISGWRVLTAKGPAEARSLYSLADIVLTDWVMPDGGGARVLRECHRPAVVYSSSVDLVDHPYRISKPTPVATIFAALAYVIAHALPAQRYGPPAHGDSSSS